MTDDPNDGFDDTYQRLFDGAGDAGVGWAGRASPALTLAGENLIPLDPIGPLKTARRSGLQIA